MNIREARAVLVRKLERVQQEKDAFDIIVSACDGLFCTSTLMGLSYRIAELKLAIQKADEHIEENKTP